MKSKRSGEKISGFTQKSLDLLRDNNSTDYFVDLIIFTFYNYLHMKTCIFIFSFFSVAQGFAFSINSSKYFYFECDTVVSAFNEPSLVDGKPVKQYKKGAKVRVTSQHGDFLKTYDGVYVPKDNVKSIHIGKTPDEVISEYSQNIHNLGGGSYKSGLILNIIMPLDNRYK